MVPDPARIEEAPGPLWCRAWTRSVDDALGTWLRAAMGSAPTGVAVVALGGYARADLCPASDIDLLLLHDGWPKPDLEHLVQRICYPLWDAGLFVGYAVRTPREALQAAGERVDTATALCDRRLVAGDRGLLDGLAARVARWTARRRTFLLEELAAADAQRHAAAGGQPGMLEPHLKNGVGGLRDLHSLRWAAQLQLGELGLDPLVGARYLAAAERRELARAGELLLQVRCALHQVRGATRPAGETDRLRADLQDAVARRLSLTGPAALRREVNLAARTVAYLHGRVWAALISDPGQTRRWHRPAPRVVDDGILLSDGQITLPVGSRSVHDPSLPLRAVAAAAAAGTHLHREAATLLRRELAVAEPLPWDERSRGALLELLRHADQGAEALRDADHIGVLGAYLPDWSRVRGRAQHNPWHRFELDTHLWQTVVELCRLTREGPHARLWRQLADPDAVLLAALLHDVGKAWDGDHSSVGAEVSRGWLLHMGMTERRVAHVATLVRHHLLLPDVAMHRDLDDDSEIEGLAKTLEDVEVLNGLYLLSLADGRATGPAVSSAWREELLRLLRERAEAVLTTRIWPSSRREPPRSAPRRATSSSSRP